MRLWFFAAWAAALASSCGNAEAFVCQADSQCLAAGRAGQCQPDGFCGFPADDCESGVRYGDQSGPLSGQCVPVVGTGGIDSTSGADSTMTAASTTGSVASTDGAVDDTQDSGGTTLRIDETTSSGAGSSSGTVGEGTTALASTGSEASGGSTSASMDGSLVLWLTFDGDDDDMGADASGYGNHGSCDPEHCPQIVPGMMGGAADFDGEDDLIVIPHDITLETPEAFTVAAWARSPEAEVLAGRTIVSKAVGDAFSNSWELYYSGGQPEVLRLAMGQEGGSDVVVFDAEKVLKGEWVHYAGVWNGDELELFVDGASVGAEPIAALWMDEHEVLVGANDDNAIGIVSYYAGTIDEVRLYDRALTPAEVAALATP